MYVSEVTISSSCQPPPSWGPGSWQQSSDRQTKREYSSRGRPVRTNTRGRGSGSRDVPPRFANNPAAKNMRNERKSGDYDVEHGSNPVSAGTDGKETYDDDVFEQKEPQDDVFEQEIPSYKENKTGHDRRQFSNSITGSIQPLMEIETHRPNHMVGSKSVGLGSQQKVFSSRSSKSSSSSEALSSGSEGGTDEWKTVGTGRRGSRKESKPDSSKRFKSDSKRLSVDIGEWKEVSSRHRQEYVSKSRNSRSSFSSGSSSPREGTGRLSPREDSRRSSNKENTRKSSHREETGKSTLTEDSRRSSAREDAKRSSPREETERTSLREDTKRSSPREETRRLSHREGTGRSSTREDSRRSSYREETGRSSHREGTGRSSPREDFRRSSYREEIGRSSHREDTRRSHTERTGKSSPRERTEKSSHKEITGKSSRTGRSSPSEEKERSYVEDSGRLSLQREDEAILAIADWAEEVRSTSPAQWVDPEVLSPGWEERPVQKDLVSWIGKTWQETLKELEKEKSEWKPKVVYFSPELHDKRMR